MPHIFAANDEDAYFALGYVHAQDRLWQMDLQRRAGAGRLAEIVGADAMPYDRYMRTLGIYRLAEDSYRDLSPPVQKALDAYAAGVNAWIDTRPGPLPPEFHILQYAPEPWRPADSLVWGKLMALQLSTNARDEILRTSLLKVLKPEQVADLFPAYPQDAAVTLQTALNGVDMRRMLALLPPDLGPSKASNEWVVSGAHTATGRPLLVNDPHLALNAPILWYLARIETPTLSITGATVPGVPFHLLGQNQEIAWGFTTAGGDVQDLFIERIDPNDPARYLTPNGSEPFQTRIEDIWVKGGERVSLTVRETRHGPVVSDIPDSPLARGWNDPAHVVSLAFPALLPGDTTAEGLYRLNHTRSWDDFRTAMTFYKSPQQNVVFASRSGDIGFMSPGLVPVRKGRTGQVPVAGWLSENDWAGFLGLDQLPQSLNPASGKFVNANNAMVGPDYPHYIATDWDDPFRADRIDEVLDQQTPQTIETSEALLADTLSPPVALLRPWLLRIESRITDPAAQIALALVKEWGGQMDRDKVAPLAFEAWLREMHRALYADELGSLFSDAWRQSPRVIHHLLTDAPQWCDNVTTPAVESCEDTIQSAFETALAELTQHYGPDPNAWRWGKAHIAPLNHEVLSRIPLVKNLFDIGVETDGGFATVNRGATRISDPLTPFANIHGAGYRAIYDLANRDNSRFIITTGQSGNPLSSYYGNMVERWRNGQHRTISGTREEVVKDAIGVLRLVPGTPSP